LIWKQSIIIPLLKQGKLKSDAKSYRPVALTSHTGKLMEKVILNRLVYYCEKNKIVPVNQAGFRKGRSTIDHLVKLTTQIKHQFARRQNILATFFDINKAYDQVWHARLLYKLKCIGLSSFIYSYFRNFLTGRSIQAKVGNTYSTLRFPQMGIPQGSVIAPYLFNILLHDIPEYVSDNVVLVQYADDLCMWKRVTMKKVTPKRHLNYVRKLYQLELDKIYKYMVENGLGLSTEKTQVVPFNNGADPPKLPVFKIGEKVLDYKPMVKLLGIILTSKLTWHCHIEYALNKARRSLNVLKAISRQIWAQDSLVYLK